MHCLRRASQPKVLLMTFLRTSRLGFLTPLLLVAAPLRAVNQPSPQAIAGFNSYIQQVESRLAQQHQSAATFLAPEDYSRLCHGDLLIEHLTPAQQSFPGAMLHHWRGTIFVPGATAADFDRLLRNVPAYPQVFSPQVLRVNVLSQNRDRYQIEMCLRQHHVLTIVLGARYNVTFSQLDPNHRYSISRSTRVAEIASPGAFTEHDFPPNQANGFLWRMNTYWSYEQRDGGLVLQLESVSLTRSIPYGLGWAVTPLVESIPRESLEFTLRSVRKALSKQKGN